MPTTPVGVVWSTAIDEVTIQSEGCYQNTPQHIFKTVLSWQNTNRERSKIQDMPQNGWKSNTKELEINYLLQLAINTRSKMVLFYIGQNQEKCWAREIEGLVHVWDMLYFMCTGSFKTLSSLWSQCYYYNPHFQGRQEGWQRLASANSECESRSAWLQSLLLSINTASCK